MGDEKLTPREYAAALVAAVQAERAKYEAKLVECAFDDCGHFAVQHDEDGVCDARVNWNGRWYRCPCNVFVPSSDGSGRP